MSEGTQFSILALVSKSAEPAIRATVASIPNCSLRCETGDNPLGGMLQCERADLVLLDTEAIPLNAIDAVSLIKASFPESEVVLLLRDQDLTTDVELMKLGAYGSLPNPPTIETLESLVRGLITKNETGRENRALVDALGETRTHTIVSHSMEMEKVLSMAARAASSQATVLITGESGTGKELVARAIHLVGPRKHKPFVPVNIAALSENLIESELFGHVKGSFTGALADRGGRFALANGGTLFIDEIGEVPPGIQVKLLRVLQFGSYERVGESQVRQADVRIVAATNRDLEAEVRSGRFRADLYYRVNVVPVHVPPLREHRSDIPYLVDFFLKKYAAKNHSSVRGITAEALARIMRYSFPGNVRELENIIERGIVLSRGEYLTESDIFLPGEPSRPEANPASAEESARAIPENYEEAMGDFERMLLSGAMERNRGNKSAAARELGINERRLRYRLKTLGLAD